MPVPEPLKSLLDTRRFWTDFLWETRASRPAGEGPPYPELRGARVDLPVAGGSALRLSLDEHLASFGLDLVASGREAVNVAWDDQAHWHPHVLRWEELETIGRAIAMHDAELAHPGVVVLLLHRFAPICEGDDIDAVVATLGAAWKGLGLFTPGEIATWIERIDARDAGFRWRRHDPEGWCIEQDDETEYARGLYSLRQVGSESFPFAEWGRMIGAAGAELARLRAPADATAREFAATGRPELIPAIARSLRGRGHETLAASLLRNPAPPQAGWIAEETLGLPAGSLSARSASPAWRPRPKHALSLRIPHRDEERPVPVPFAYLFHSTLDRVLRSLNRGESHPSGGSSIVNPDGTYTTTETNYSIELKGDLEEGVHVVRDLLRWADAPGSVRLIRAGGGEIPLALGRPPAGPSPLLFQLGALNTVRWRNGYRLDRVPLSAASRRRVRAMLSRWGADGPDEDGWSRVTADDGGRLGLDVGHPEDDPAPDGLTVVLDHLTPGAAALVHQLMAAEALMLLPPLLATSAEVAAQVAAPWPEVRVVATPGALHEILAAGPHAWWAGASRP